MKHISYIIFLATIIIISVFTQCIMPSIEGFVIIKDNSGNTYVVDGDYTQDGNGNITNADGEQIDFDEIPKNDKTKTADASGNMLNLDAEGDTQYNVVNGEVIENEAWNADTAFPEYHESASDLATKDTRIKSGKMYVRGPSGEIIEVPWTGKQTPINYNESGYFRFQPSNFVPGYEDSVYLSRLTGYSTTKPVENTASQMGGFCDYHKHSPVKKEEACSKIR